MVFLLSHAFNGVVASTKKLDKPINLAAKYLKKTSKPLLQEKRALEFQKSSHNTKEQIINALNLPRLNTIQSAIAKGLNRPKNQVEVEIDAQENNTRIFSFKQNNFKYIDKTYNSITKSALNKIDYKYEKTDIDHKIKQFSFNTLIDRNLNDDENKFNLVLSYFFNTSKEYKPLKLFNTENLTVKDLFHSLDPHKTNTTSITDINLIDESLALTLAKNKQRLLIDNGVEVFVLIPRIEINQATNNQEVYWHWINNNEPSIIKSNYKDLTPSQQEKYLKQKAINITKKEIINKNYENTLKIDEINSIEKILLDLNNKKDNIEQTEINTKNKNFDINLYFPYQKILKQIDEYNNRLTELKFDKETGKPIYLKKNNKSYIDLLKYNTRNENNAIFTKNYKHIENEVDVKPPQTFNLNQVLNFIKHDNIPLNIVSSKKSYSISNLPSFVRPNISQLGLTYELQQKFSKFKSNKETNTLLDSMSKLYGTNYNEFILLNPSLARNIDSIKQTPIENLLKSTNNYADKFDLNNIYKYKNNHNHKKRKNGASGITMIEKAIYNKQAMILEIKSSITNPLAKNKLLLLENINHNWYVKDINNNQPAQKIDSLAIYIENISKKNKAFLYCKRQAEFSRPEWRCKFRKIIGRDALTLHDKIDRDQKVWDDERNKKAVIRTFRATQTRNEVGHYKQTQKPYQNVGFRFINEYINPLSKQHRKAWRSGRQMRLAFFDREDTLRRLWGSAKGGMTQPQDTLAAHSMRVAGTNPVFGDMSMQGGLAVMSDAFCQLFADSVQKMAYGTMAKYQAGITAGANKTMNELSQEARLLTKSMKSNLELFDNIYDSIKSNKSLTLNGKKIKFNTFNINGKKVKLEEAKQIVFERLIDNLVRTIQLVQQHKAQSKSGLGIAFIDQFLQNIVRMGWLACIIINPALKGAELLPHITRIDLLVRKLIQTPMAAIDNNLRQEYFLRTQANMPGHMMTENAIKYSLDRLIGKLSPIDFENHVINIMTQYGETPYNAQQIKEMPNHQKELLLAEFVFSAENIHENVTYNATTRAELVKGFIEVKISDYRIREMQYHKQIKQATDENIKNHYKNKLEILQAKIQSFKEEAILFNQGLEYIKAKNSNPPKFVDANYKFAWGTLEKNYPNGKLVNLIQSKNPFPLLRKSFKNVINQPGEFLLHTLFRASNWSLMMIDEVGTEIAKCTESNGGGAEAQKIALATLYAGGFSASIVSGIYAYLDNIGNFSRPDNHEIYICAFIWKLQQHKTEIENKIYKFYQEMHTQEIEELSIKQRQHIKGLQNTLDEINILENYLKNDVKPKESISNLKELTDTIINIDNNNNITRSSFDAEILKKHTQEMLCTSFASILPRTDSSFNHRVNSQDNWIHTAAKNTKYWYKGESIVAPIVDKLRNGIKQGNNIDIIQQTAQKANEKIRQYANFNGLIQEDDDYYKIFTVLYNKIPQGDSKNKADHAVNRRLFINKIYDLLEQTTIEIKNYEVQNNIQALGYNDKTHYDNYINLQDDLKKFLNENQDISVPDFKEYIYLDDMRSVETGEILFNKVTSEQISQNRNKDKFESFDLRPRIEINLSNTYKWYELESRGSIQNKPLDTQKNKILNVTKQVGLWTYQRILNPFHQKSISKYFINPSYRHWLPYTVIRQGAITPFIIYESIKKVVNVRETTYAAQDIVENKNVQDTFEESINLLQAEADAVKYKLKQQASTPIIEDFLGVEEQADVQKATLTLDNLHELYANIENLKSLAAYKFISTKENALAFQTYQKQMFEI